MKKENLIFLVPIVIIAVATIWLSMALTPIQETVIERLHVPVNVDVLSSATNHDLTCFKIGLYTNWDERWTGKLSGYLTGIYAGEHARQMFFEYDCYCHDSTHGMRNWHSDKMCLAELYPHD